MHRLAEPLRRGLDRGELQSLLRAEQRRDAALAHVARPWRGGRSRARRARRPTRGRPRARARPGARRRRGRVGRRSRSWSCILRTIVRIVYVRPFVFISTDATRHRHRRPPCTPPPPPSLAALRAADRVSPALAGRLALPLFRQVRPALPVRPADRAVHEHAERGTITVRGREIVTYSWGRGPETVLVVHGWRGRASQFGPIVRELRAEGFRVVGFDAPGERRLRGPPHRHPRLPRRHRGDAAAPRHVPGRRRALVRRAGRAHRRARGHRDRRRGRDRRHGRRPLPRRLLRRAGRRRRGDRRRARGASSPGACCPTCPSRTRASTPSPARCPTASRCSSCTTAATARSRHPSRCGCTRPTASARASCSPTERGTPACSAPTRRSTPSRRSRPAGCRRSTVPGSAAVGAAERRRGRRRARRRRGGVSRRGLEQRHRSRCRPGMRILRRARPPTAARPRTPRRPERRQDRMRPRAADRRVAASTRAARLPPVGVPRSASAVDPGRRRARGATRARGVVPAEQVGERERVHALVERRPPPCAAPQPVPGSIGNPNDREAARRSRRGEQVGDGGAGLTHPHRLHEEDAAIAEATSRLAAFIVNAFSSSTGVPCSRRRARSAWLSWVVACTRSRSSGEQSSRAIRVLGEGAVRPHRAGDRTSSKRRGRKSGTIMSAIQPVPMMPTRSRWSLVMAPR